MQLALIDATPPNTTKETSYQHHLSCHMHPLSALFSIHGIYYYITKLYLTAINMKPALHIGTGFLP